MAVHAELRPPDLGHQEQVQGAGRVDAVPDELYVPGQRVLADQLAHLVGDAAQRPARPQPGRGGEDGVGVHQQHLPVRVGAGDRLQVARLVVDHGHHAKPLHGELPDRVGLRFRHVVVELVIEHHQQIVAEAHLELATERVQRFQRGQAHRLRPPGDQRDVRVGLNLEPADHLQHAVVRAVRGQDHVAVPAARRAPVGGVRGRSAAVGELPETAVGHGHRRHGQVREVTRAVRLVVAAQQMQQLVAAVQDGAVDVEHDQQVVVRVQVPAVRIVLGEPVDPRLHGRLRSHVCGVARSRHRGCWPSPLGLGGSRCAAGAALRMPPRKALNAVGRAVRPRPANC